MNLPFVSIIIPARNEEKNIERCLRSISKLDWPSDRFEVIVIDNCSTDRTSEIARSFGSRVLNRTEGKVGRLRNEGVRVSKGEIIAFVDADCEVPADWLRMGTRMVTKPGVGIAGSYPDIPVDSTPLQRVWSLNNLVRRDREDADWVPSMNMFVRKEVFESPDIKGFNETLESCEDVDLCLRVKRKVRIVYSKEIMNIHHGEPAGLKDFIRREFWHGKGNIRGFFSHPFTLSEIPSIMIPFLFIVLLSLLLFDLATLPFHGEFRASTPLAISLLLFLPLFRAMVTVIKARRYKYLPSLTLLFFIYYLVRGVAMIWGLVKWSNR